MMGWWSEAGVWEPLYRVEARSKLFCRCAADVLQFEREPWPPSRLPGFSSSGLCCGPMLQDEIKIPIADQIDLTTMPVEDSYDGPRLSGEVSQYTLHSSLPP